METNRRSWRSEAARVVPLALVSLIAWILPTLQEGQVLSGVANAVVLAAALFVVARWRRRHPLIVSVATSVALIFFPSLWLVAGWAYLSLATRLRLRATVGAGVVAYIGSVLSALFSDQQTAELTVQVVVSNLGFNALVVVALGAVGAYLGASRRERAATAERLATAEQARLLTEENARVEERNRIAREMHDVLAHKITLISLHAGALEYRADLTPDEVRQAGATIRASSHEALVELRGILGQLRQTDDSGAPAKPQPGLEEIGELIEEHRGAGRKVEFESNLAGTPSETMGRHAYRVLRESLTNAARHAPGTAVRVQLTGDEEQGINLRITNRLSIAAADSPGAGLGLVGLRERVEYVGGRLTAGPTAAGEFTVECRLPWRQA